MSSVHLPIWCSSSSIPVIGTHLRLWEMRKVMALMRRARHGPRATARPRDACNRVIRPVRLAGNAVSTGKGVKQRGCGGEEKGYLGGHVNPKQQDQQHQRVCKSRAGQPGYRRTLIIESSRTDVHGAEHATASRDATDEATHQDQHRDTERLQGHQQSRASRASSGGSPAPNQASKASRQGRQDRQGK
jgi:hypothetical protein